VATFRGVCWLLVLVLTTAALAGFLDWRWHLPGLVRAVVLAGTLAGAGIVSFRYLVGPLSARTDDLTLALRVEEHYPALNDALASTVQFLDQTGAPVAASPGLQKEAVRRGLGRAEGLDFNRVVDARGIRIAGLSAAVACALAVTLIGLFPAAAATALARLANPFGKSDWPRATRLEIESPRLRVGRNETYEVRGRVAGVIPEHATVSFFFEGFPAIEHRCEITRDEEDNGRFATKLDSTRVSRNFRFQVRANDAESEIYEVKVLPPPELVLLNGQPSPQLMLHYPAYTDLPSPQKQTPGSGNVEAVAGTSVTLRAAANRSLRRAWIEFKPDLEHTKTALALAPLGAGHAPGVAASVAAGREVWETVDATLDGGGCNFTIDFYPRANGLYVLHFEDETGLAGAPRTYELRLKPDPAPLVSLDRPSPSRDVLTVLPEAVLRLQVSAEDQEYALRSVFLEYRTQRLDASRSLFLYHHKSAGRAFAPWAGSTVLGAPLRMRPTRLEFDQPLPLKSLRHPDGSPLKEGDVVILIAAADDFDDVTIDKQPGRSHEVEIRIVSRPELEAVLNQEQAKVQQDLVRLRENEREAMRHVTDALNKLKKGEKLTPEEFAKLLQAEQLQQQMLERVGDEKEGLRADVARIQRAIKQNELPDTSAHDMKEVARQLDRLAENELRQIESKLADARKRAELLDDDKGRAERRARLEEKAREEERDARAAEKDARRAEAAAEAAEKAKQKEEAKRQRQKAEELKQKARELDQQAARDRREATELQDPNSPVEGLTDTRKRQEEVEKTLTDLLTRMEPWSNTREIKGEAAQLLQEQRRLQAQLEKLQQDKELKLAGEKPENLNERQRTELENARDAQRRLEERAKQLLDKMDRVAKERAEKDPEMAQGLRDAAAQAEKADIAGQMKAAGEQIPMNQLANAKRNQDEAVAGLQKLIKTLEDRGEDELNRLAKKQREAEKELAELLDEQERLQKKIKEADQIPDKERRQEALKGLAREQEQLRKKAKNLLEKLSRLRAERAGEALAKSEEAMKLTRDKLEKGEMPEDEDEALDRLDETQRELQQAREETEEHLAREQLARVADTLKRIRERQEGLNVKFTTIQKEVLENKGWSRGQKLDLPKHVEAQKGLGDETSKVARDELTGAPVFARLVQRAADAMTKAAGELKDADKLPPEGSVFKEEALELQKEALRRLDQLLEAIKPEDGVPAPRLGKKDDQKGGQPPGGNDGGNPPPNDGLPPVAQLKLLKALQQEVNQKTDSFRQKHPDVSKLGEKDKAELQAIRKEQQEVADLLEELTRPAGEPGAAPGEKP
jgi:hypothetical protein